MQKILEVLVEVRSKELVRGGRIELEKFSVLGIKHIDRGPQAGMLFVSGNLRHAPPVIRKLTVRLSKDLKKRLKIETDIVDDVIKPTKSQWNSD